MQPNIVSYAIGLVKGLNVIFYRLQWAESSTLVRSNSLKRQANTSIFSAAILAAYVGLHGSLVQQLIVHPMANASPLPIGPCEPIANWPMQGLACNFSQAAVGQLTQLKPIANWPM